MYLTSIPYLARSCLYVVPNCSALRLEVFASRISQQVGMDVGRIASSPYI
jgi:hypothetical protein